MSHLRIVRNWSDGHRNSVEIRLATDADVDDDILLATGVAFDETKAAARRDLTAALVALDTLEEPTP